jgi:hypothetical protein
MRFTLHSLVPVAVLLLTAAAVASALQPDAVRPAPGLVPASTQAGGELSARGLWADARGNTVLVSERLPFDDGDRPPAVELRYFDALGRTAWLLSLGEGAVTSLVEDQEVMYLALARPTSAAFPGARTTLIAVSMDSGAMRWKLELEGEVTDLLADGAGGLRARSLRMEKAGASSEHLLSLRDGALLWDVALND